MEVLKSNAQGLNMHAVNSLFEFWRTVFRPHDSFKDMMLHNIVRDAFVMMANSPLNFISLHSPLKV